MTLLDKFTFAARCVPGGFNPQETIDYMRRCMSSLHDELVLMNDPSLIEAADVLYDVLIKLPANEYTEAKVDELIRSFAMLSYDHYIEVDSFKQDLTDAGLL